MRAVISKMLSKPDHHRNRKARTRKARTRKAHDSDTEDDDSKSSSTGADSYTPKHRTKKAVKASRSLPEPRFYCARKKGSRDVWVEKREKHHKRTVISRPCGAKRKKHHKHKHERPHRRGQTLPDRKDQRHKHTPTPKMHQKTSHYASSSDHSEGDDPSESEYDEGTASPTDVYQPSSVYTDEDF